ncbi:kinetochore-associated protein NSL1 homolog [Salminus brasiliensis]|uniref:kinetochore-associated protein NSL1 homolog n=1 Tax=Salminus brasiliensis TaxID=930266 RepID=UPI003B830082
MQTNPHDKCSSVAALFLGGLYFGGTRHFEQLAAEMEDRVGVSDPEKKHDFRIHVKSKRHVTNQLTRYKDLLKTLFDGQSQLSEDDKAKLSQEMLMNFEHVVQENLAVDGLSWEEAADEDGEECEVSTLDDLLDEKIVQTTRKRSIYPKKILPYVVRSLKAERKLMGLFDSTIVPQEVKRDPAQDTIMNNVSAAAPGMFNQASTVIKSLKALKQTAEGLHQVLNMQPSAETLEVYREVFGSSNGEACPVLCNRGPSTRMTIKRAVSETEYSMDYVPMPTTPAALAENN